MVTQKYLDTLSYDIIGAAIEVQKTMGIGLAEKVYHSCMKEELENRNIAFRTELKVPLVYKGKKLETDFRCDLLIENCIVLELKSVKEINPLFETQLLTYMKLLECPKGILINFFSKNIFYEGQKTFINKYFDQLPNQ